MLDFVVKTKASDGCLSPVVSLELTQKLLRIVNDLLASSVACLDFGKLVVSSKTVDHSGNKVGSHQCPLGCSTFNVSSSGWGWEWLNLTKELDKQICHVNTRMEVSSSSPVGLFIGDVVLNVSVIFKVVCTHRLK